MDMFGLGLSNPASFQPSALDSFPLGGAKLWKSYALVHRALEAAQSQNLSPARAQDFHNAELLLNRLEARSLAELFMPAQYSWMTSFLPNFYA